MQCSSASDRARKRSKGLVLKRYRCSSAPWRDARPQHITQETYSRLQRRSASHLRPCSGWGGRYSTTHLPLAPTDAVAVVSMKKAGAKKKNALQVSARAPQSVKTLTARTEPFTGLLACRNTRTRRRSESGCVSRHMRGFSMCQGLLWSARARWVSGSLVGRALRVLPAQPSPAQQSMHRSPHGRGVASGCRSAMRKRRKSWQNLRRALVSPRLTLMPRPQPSLASVVRTSAESELL